MQAVNSASISTSETHPLGGEKVDEVNEVTTQGFPEILDRRSALLSDLSRGKDGELAPQKPSSAADPESSGLALPAPPCANGMDDYARLQSRLLMATLIIAVVAVLLTTLLFGSSSAISLMVGAFAGMLYLKLLARSVARIGSNSRNVGKAQLLVPVVLVLAAARLPALDIVPVLIGFLLYKPAILIQALIPARVSSIPG